MFWSENIINGLVGHQKVSTGISPSGPIHLGNLREIITGDILYKTCIKNNIDADFIYLCDDVDPLRKVYPFLDQSYEKFVGKPLYRIPAPSGEGTYSEYFLNPFRDSMEKLDIHPKVIETHNLYKDGILGSIIIELIEKREIVKEIIEKVSGRKLDALWFPYSPICSKCGSIKATSAKSLEGEFVRYRCKCGNEGEANVYKDEGKLPWRLEWPAKWKALNVTIEPFGKDHGTPGGSYDTAKALCEKILNYKTPVPLVYERILLKGKGAMHSSTGVAIPASEILSFMPPDTVRYLISRVSPSKHIDFDPGEGLLFLMDEFEKNVQMYREGKLDEDGKMSVEMSLVYGKTGVADFRHISTLIQVYGDKEKVMEALKRSGKNPEDYGEIFDLAKKWTETYSPDSYKIEISPINAVVNLNEKERNMINFALNMLETQERWDSEFIHSTLREAIGKSGLSPQDGFSCLYRIFIGKEKGPRLGFFLSIMERDYVLKRLKSILEIR